MTLANSVNRVNTGWALVAISSLQLGARQHGCWRAMVALPRWLELCSRRFLPLCYVSQRSKLKSGRNHTKAAISLRSFVNGQTASRSRAVLFPPQVILVAIWLRIIRVLNSGVLVCVCVCVCACVCLCVCDTFVVRTMCDLSR